jgi:hypothetical protein
MAKRLSDDEAMDMAYRKLFGDLDNIESRTLFDGEKMEETGHTAPNAKPESESSGGVTITVEPIMKAAEEGGKMTDFNTDGDEDNDDDKLKGIGEMSPLMAQLHGRR